MVRLKIAYWEFDFKAVCPTLDHDLLSQAHIYIHSFIFNYVLFSAEVHNPLHAHLLALSHI